MPRGASRAIYAGNGQAVEFPFLFKVWEEDQLSVLVTSPSGVTAPATGWTAELDEGGGTVRYLHQGAPLPEGWKLAIMRDMPFVQEVDLITGTRFDPEVIETALDVATAERQQLLERLARAVVVEPTDEAGPEALLTDIRESRASALASATSAGASAAAAGSSAQSAAGSAAIATEQREAACACAGVAMDARNAAIAQAEAANTLMEAELAKVNAIVAANKSDQEAAIEAARLWSEKAPDVPVDYDEEGNPRYSARHWAENARKVAIEPPTAERRGAIRVGEGLKLETGENGETDVLAADTARLGGRLLANEEVWITASGTYTAPCTGVYEVLLVGGGNGGEGYSNTKIAIGGASGEYLSRLVWLTAGEEVPVTIGSGGIGVSKADKTAAPDTVIGGSTVFGALRTKTCSNQNYSGAKAINSFPPTWLYWSGTNFGYLFGSGLGSSTATSTHYGCGGGARQNAGFDGAPGIIRLRFHDPAKAPQEAPAASPASVAGAGARMALRRAVKPLADAEEAALIDAAPESALVALYDPETGLGSVWRSEDAERKLAEGFLARETWAEICAERAAEAQAAWLADPESEAERFDLLRQARDARLSATDYLVVSDYPLSDEQRAAVTAYRQALRDLPAQVGAPWDGGGELTPWPEMPAVTQNATQVGASCA